MQAHDHRGGGEVAVRRWESVTTGWDFHDDSIRRDPLPDEHLRNLAIFPAAGAAARDLYARPPPGGLPLPETGLQRSRAMTGLNRFRNVIHAESLSASETMATDSAGRDVF